MMELYLLVDSLIRSDQQPGRWSAWSEATVCVEGGGRPERTQRVEKLNFTYLISPPASPVEKKVATHISALFKRP